MKKEEFLSYCNRIGNMMSDVDDWTSCPPSIIGDYLRENTGYGFAQVLYDLAQSTFKLFEEEDCKSVSGQYDLYELASLLSVKCVLPDYRFGAYVFAVCVMAVCLGKKHCDEIDCEQFDENDLKSFDVTVVDDGETDPQAKKLKWYGLRLLDFSRNNQLVNFRPTKSSTISLVSSDMSRTMALVAAKKKIYFGSWQKLDAQTILKCRTCGRVATARYDGWAKKAQSAAACPVCDEGNTHNRRSMTPLKEKLTFFDGDVYKCKCGKVTSVDGLYRNGLICPECGEAADIPSFPLVTRDALAAYSDTEVVCGVSDNDAHETAKRLYNKAKSMERNFGLHVLYLACGFLRWRDGNNTEYNSPILLCPINLTADRSAGTYCFDCMGAADSGFEVNKTLVHMLASYSKICSINLPELDEHNLGAYLTQVKHVLHGTSSAISAVTKDWQIVPEMGIGLFHYQKLQLENDMRENRDKYLAHPVIRRLCGDEDCEIGRATVLSDKLHHMTMDADSSQENVVKAAQEGKSFILQGPPGSGKSQTITNIISVAIGEGKSVLFVTEKASARSVILDNLSRLTVDGTHKLNGFVLDFDSFNKRGGAIGRDPFIKELNDCLPPFIPPAGYDDQILADEAFLKARVERFMREYKDEYGGRSLQGLLQGVAAYAQYGLLYSIHSVPADRIALNELSDLLGRYYALMNKYGGNIDYRRDELYGCYGDLTSDLYGYAYAYGKIGERIEGLTAALNGLGWIVTGSDNAFEKAAALLAEWAKMPVLTPTVLNGLDEVRLAGILRRAKSRREELDGVVNHRGVQIRDELDLNVYDEEKLKSFVGLKIKYKLFLKRFGGEYKQFIADVAGCFKLFGEKPSYKSAGSAIDKLQLYQHYLDRKAEYAAGEEDDVAAYGYAPRTLDEWDALIGGLSAASAIVNYGNFELINPASRQNWLNSFAYPAYQARVEYIASLAAEVKEASDDERDVGDKLKSYFDKSAAVSRGYPRYTALAATAVKNSARLADWYRICEAVEGLASNRWNGILDEFIQKNITGFESVKGSLYRTFYEKEVSEFVRANGLGGVADFNRTAHEKLMTDYANADGLTLKRGALRLYGTLARRLQAEGKARSRNPNSSDLPRLQNRTGYSIKRTISENWEYVKRIKPCFMMSPLNVSQYIDVNTQFDLVIFDEASQIFTEDALASIVRAKQVIIAGDSKQLPPCDFFRAGDVSQDDEEQYFEDESNSGNSLLDTADGVLKDDEASASLTWHYRSCDEALIAFSNDHMQYDLVTFPSAVKNENDGISFVQVPYSPKTCYEAGKSGTHVNKGEADEIIRLIWEEMNHPERGGFSIGVVAFSNAQAVEIETRWEAFKLRPDKRAFIEKWEKAHASEPIIFCNLDTMQGDERDTMLISICYSQDANGKFVLPYLGRVRLPSGKKRINVAVTRSRHRMIVVSTLDEATLKAAIETSSAPEENKEGANMLYEFLRYAKRFVNDNEVACGGEVTKPFSQSVCRVLDEAGIAYDVEIGRSKCKIDIGIRNPQKANSFVLGIIIDDPGRADFDSPREYVRLTEQVLCGKYNWSIYRVFPLAWVNDYEREKELLLQRVREALN